MDDNRLAHLKHSMSRICFLYSEHCAFVRGCVNFRAAYGSALDGIFGMVSVE